MASASAPGISSSTRANRRWCSRTVGGESWATIVSRMRSWVVSTTSRPSRKPVRAKRRALRTDTTSCTPPSTPDALATTETGSGRPLTATISITFRACSGRRSRRSLTIWSSVRTARVAPVAEATPRLLRTSSSMRNGLPRDSRATARAVLRAISSVAPRSVVANLRASSTLRGPTAISREIAPAAQRSRISIRNGLVFASSSRNVMTSSRGGGFGGRSSSSKSPALSVSPQ